MGSFVPQVVSEDRASGAQIVDGGLRFDSGKSQYLSRTPSTAGNRKTWTWSGWVKRNDVSSQQTLFSAGNSGTNRSSLLFDSSVNGALRYFNYASTVNVNLISSQVFRDAAGWYHIVVAFDSTQATEANRLKFYVNGVQVTNFSTATYPSQNLDVVINNNLSHSIGRAEQASPAEHLSGQISNEYFIDGQALDPSYFGYTDPLTNVWRPKKYNQISTIDSYSAGVSLTATPYTDLGSSNCTITNSGSVTSSSAGTNSFGLTTAADMTGAQRVDINMGNVSSTFFQSAWTLEMFFKTSNINDGWFVGTAQDGSVWQTGWSMQVESSGTLKWNYDSSGGGSQVNLISGLSANTWYFMRVQRTPGSSTALRVWVYSSPTTLVGSYSGTVSDTSTQTQNTLKIGDANGNANNLAGNWQFANVMLTAGLVRKQEVPTLNSSGVRALNAVNTLSIFDNYGINGFYLPFDGSAPIGQDQSGRGNNWTPVNFGGSNTIEKATGALPILNTDGGGKVARVGVRTDANASSLVLALPLVGIKSDFSNAVNSGTSNKDITNTSVTFSSSYSNFYGGSGYFNGSAYLRAPAGTDFTYGTGDFTFEGWIYPTTSADQLIYGQTSSGNNFINISLAPTTNLLAAQINSSGAGNAVVSTIPVTLNTWNHIAVTRENTVVKLYINGILGGSGTRNVDLSLASIQPSIGTYSHTSSLNFTGYIQDFRIYKGLAKYTSNFIPASTDPDIAPDSPSGVSYSSNLTQITDGAVSFDGTSYLTVADGVNDFAFGTGAYTVEGFLYPTTLTGNGDANPRFFCCGTPSASSNRNQLQIVITASGEIRLDTNSTTYASAANDVVANKWQHIAVARDGSGNLKAFVDGRQVISQTGVNNNITNNDGISLGIEAGASSRFTGFMSNVQVIKGTALYTSNFTPPSAPISSVANTKLLCCKSNSSATAFDVSPGSITANGNAIASNFNPFTVNINTQRGKQSGYCTLNPLDNYNLTVSNGNLTVSASSAHGLVRGNVGMNTATGGKYYWEYTSSGWSNQPAIGIVGDTAKISDELSANPSRLYRASNQLYVNGTENAGWGPSWTTSDTIGIAFDATNGILNFYINGILVGSPVTGLTGTWLPGVKMYDGTSYLNFGQKPFKFPPPAGFQPLTLANTPRPTIVRPDQYVGVTTYTGNTPSSQSVNVGFKPDMVWLKVRNAADYHQLYDSVRGVTNYLHPNVTNAEATDANALTAFTRTGFNVGSTGGVNSNNMVAWAWKAGGNSNTFNIDDVGYSTASAAGLTAGTIAATGASIGTKLGFSIIKYRTSGSGTVPHGLTQAPEVSLAKRMNGTSDWYFRVNIGSVNGYMLLNGTGALTGSFSVTSTTVQGADFGSANEDWILYNWHSVPGFSKFGTYTGNLSADGVFVQTGFRPRWILLRRTAGQWWFIYDSVRYPSNQSGTSITPYISTNANTEGTGNSAVDFLSNGFKLRVGDNATNDTSTFIYAAFAESPTFNLYGAQANAR